MLNLQKNSRRIVILILCLPICLKLSLYAMSAQGHNEDIGYILYGYRTWGEFAREGNDQELLSYYQESRDLYNSHEDI